MTDCLFVGSFLSSNMGSLSVSEFVAEKLKNLQLNIEITSTYKNKIIRIFDIAFTILTTQTKYIHIEVYSGSAFKIAEIASQIAKYRNITIILTLHGGKLPEFFKTNKSRFHKLFSRAKTITTPSYYLKEFFENKLFTIKYLPNSIDLKMFPFERSNIKPYTLLWVRGFSNIYNPEIAVKTLYQVRKKYPQTTLTMIGPDGGTLSKTKQLIENLKLTNAIEIIGPVANAALHSYYQKHSIYLNTPSYESFGVALIEAASCGIPIISYKVGEVPYLWTDKKNITLVECLDENQFASAIFDHFENTQKSTNQAIAAKDKAQEFEWKNIEQSWLELLAPNPKIETHN